MLAGMVVWFTRVILAAQNILNMLTILSMRGRMASQAIQALYSSPYIPHCFDDAEANVDNVDIVHLEAHAAGVCRSGEKAEDEGIKPIGIGRVPIVVNARNVVRHAGYRGQEGRKGAGVCFCGEESIYIARSCTEEQVHSRGGWRSLCLGTVAEVKKKFNQGLKRGDSLDRFGRKWESCFHIQKGAFCHS